MKRLITERDVQQLAAGAKLVVDRDTIVTPAARDLAYARGIVFAATADASSSSAEVAGAWPKLADGDWLLEVRGGKVRARRIEPTPPTS